MQPNQTLDPQVKALTKAIRESEGYKGDPHIKGASGEWGAYQFTKDTWDAYAREAGVSSPWGQASLEDQNKVAYNKLKKWKDENYNVGQIASMWNAGPGRPNAYIEGWKGVNAQGVAYDTPTYARRVAENYQKFKAEEQVMARPQVQAAQAPEENKGTNFIQDLKEISTNRLGQASTAINRGLSGEQGTMSTILQVGGAAAGGLLDVAGSLIPEGGINIAPWQHLAMPIKKKGEDMVAEGLQKAVDSETGQKVIQKVQELEQEHPTAAANIGAGVNLASAIPLVRGAFRGLSSAGGIRDAMTPIAEKEASAVTEITKTIERRATGGQAIRASEKRGLDPVGTLVKERLLPEIEQDAKGTKRYNVTKADAALDESIDRIDDQLDEVLATASTNLAGQVRLEDVKAMVLKQIDEEFKGSPDLGKVRNKVEDDFANFNLSYNRDFVSLNELNRIKREVRKSVKFDTPSMDESARYHEGQVMMRIIEQVGESQGLGDVRRINKEMANRIEAQRLLRKYVNGKSVMENPGWPSDK